MSKTSSKCDGTSSCKCEECQLLAALVSGNTLEELEEFLEMQIESKEKSPYRSKFERVKPGMTFAQVDEMIGKPGKEWCSEIDEGPANRIVMIWGASVDPWVVMFEDGRAVAVDYHSIGFFGGRNIIAWLKGEHATYQEVDETKERERLSHAANKQTN